MFLWQANIYPVLGLGNERINNANNSPKGNPTNTKEIVIQSGETLWQLAETYQTTVDDLVKLNKVKSPNQIREGQILWVPNEEAKEESEKLETRDVKEYSKEVLTTSAKASPWWANILRSIPAFATIYGRGYNTADLHHVSPGESKIETYEIFVNHGKELPENSVQGTVAESKAEINKQVTEKTGPAAESQIHSRGLGRLVTKEEVELISRVIYGEARGEDFLGQVAVGAVVLNRVNDPRFPNTIQGVIYESGAFTAVDDKQIHLNPDDQAYKAAEAALSGLDPTNGAIFYYNPRTATDKWIKSRTVIKRIGNHTFSI